MHAVRRTRLWGNQTRQYVRGLRKLAAIMKAGRTTKPLQVILVTQILLLAMTLCVWMSFGLPCPAYASEVQVSDSSQIACDEDVSLGASISEESVPLAVLNFTTSTISLSAQGQTSGSDDTTTFSVDQSQSSTDQTNYVSIRGYSAFNHFSLALKATVTAICVIGICIVALYAYHRYKRSKEE